MKRSSSRTNSDGFRSRRLELWEKEGAEGGGREEVGAPDGDGIEEKEEEEGDGAVEDEEMEDEAQNAKRAGVEYNILPCSSAAAVRCIGAMRPAGEWRDRRKSTYDSSFVHLFATSTA
jgi:hypothetical protein